MKRVGSYHTLCKKLDCRAEIWHYLVCQFYTCRIGSTHRNNQLEICLEFRVGKACFRIQPVVRWFTLEPVIIRGHPDYIPGLMDTDLATGRLQTISPKTQREYMWGGQTVQTL